jgi:FMN phosphatase YigB (HAD superfamily)
MRANDFLPSKLVIFDIDDTLVHTQTKVHVIRDGKVIKSLNSHDFTHYKLQPGEEFDFGDFRNAQEFFEKSKPIIPMLNQLKQDIATGNKVVMVTARADFDDQELFLDTFRKYGVDMNKVHVYRAGNMTGKMQTEEKKKIIIRNLLNQGKYTKAIMYDDAEPNLVSFMELKKEYPQTKFYAWHVSLEGDASEYGRTNENFADGKHPGRKGLDPEIYEDLDNGIIARVARQLVPTIRAKSTPEGYVYLKTADGLSLVIGCSIAGGSIGINIGTGHETTSSGPHKGAVTEIVQAVYAAAVKHYGTPSQPGSLSVDHDAGHGVWQHIAQKLGLEYSAHMVKENFADGRHPGRKGLAKRSGVNTKASISSLRNTAKHSSGEKQRMAHWLANMKAGREKNK